MTREQWMQLPEDFRKWLKTISVFNFISERRNEAFQMQGMHDGAMSSECKMLYKSEHQMLSDLLHHIQSEL